MNFPQKLHLNASYAAIDPKDLSCKFRTFSLMIPFTMTCLPGPGIIPARFRVPPRPGISGEFGNSRCLPARALQWQAGEALRAGGGQAQAPEQPNNCLADKK